MSTCDVAESGSKWNEATKTLHKAQIFVCDCSLTSCPFFIIACKLLPSSPHCNCGPAPFRVPPLENHREVVLPCQQGVRPVFRWGVDLFLTHVHPGSGAHVGPISSPCFCWGQRSTGALPSHASCSHTVTHSSPRANALPVASDFICLFVPTSFYKNTCYLFFLCLCLFR